jgi:predicted RNase H-like nuclease (RuvC/YqgF family)
MSDANFINVYNDVVLENFTAVLKQNFMFQTQIKFFEERVKEIPALQEKGNSYDSVVREKNELQNKIVSLTSEVENKDTIIKNSSNSDADKHRLQTALNEQARELERLSNKVSDIENDIADKNYYIKQLEDMLPNSKRKKLGLEIIESAKEEVEEVKSTEKVSVKENNVVLKVESAGGTF